VKGEARRDLGDFWGGGLGFGRGLGEILLLWGNGCGFTWFFWENTVEMLVYDE
jgi:hypothetical protein